MRSAEEQTTMSGKGQNAKHAAGEPDIKKGREIKETLSGKKRILMKMS